MPDRIIYQVKDLVNKDFCQKYINLINEDIPYMDSSIYDAIGLRSYRFTDSKLAHELCTLLRPRLDLDFVDVCETMLISKYKTNFGLEKHLDVLQYYDHGLYSKYRLLIYLNDDFENGFTIFYTDHDIKEIRPQTGSAVVFEIDNFWHAGSVVTFGTKYILACELLVTRL